MIKFDGMSDIDTLTAEEAAQELGITPSRVRQMIRAGQLQARRFGKVHVITRQALKDVEQRKTKPGPAPMRSGTDGKGTMKLSKKGSKK